MCAMIVWSDSFIVLSVFGVVFTSSTDGQPFLTRFRYLAPQLFGRQQVVSPPLVNLRNHISLVLNLLCCQELTEASCWRSSFWLLAALRHLPSFQTGPFGSETSPSFYAPSHH